MPQPLKWEREVVCLQPWVITAKNGDDNDSPRNLPRTGYTLRQAQPKEILTINKCRTVW